MLSILSPFLPSPVQYLITFQSVHPVFLDFVDERDTSWSYFFVQFHDDDDGVSHR